MCPRFGSLLRPNRVRPSQGPRSIVGSFSKLGGCLSSFGSSIAAPIIAFGSGGPPFPPIPANHEEHATIHGVHVQIFTDTDAALSLDETELLAIFPGRNVWLHAVAPGTDRHTSLDQVRQVLASVHATPGSTIVPTGPIHETFVGNWHVHDASLDISSTSTGVFIDSHGCDDKCIERDFLSLTLSAGATHMNATVTRITYTNPVTGSAVDNTDPNDTGHIGNSFVLEFSESHLMVSTDNIHISMSTDLGSGNYYWGNCGPPTARPHTSLAPRYCQAERRSVCSLLPRVRWSASNARAKPYRFPAGHRHFDVCLMANRWF